MKPPLLGRAILWLCLPVSEREAIPGDLLEEFALAILLGGGRFVLSQVPRKAETLEASFYVPVSLGISGVYILVGWLFQKRIGGKS